MMIGATQDEFPRIEVATDCCGTVRRFSVDVHTTDGGYFLRAVEEGVGQGGYEFAAHSEVSPYLALGQLRRRIRQGLATRYLTVEDGDRRLGHDAAVGTIGFGGVVIDGREVSFEEFASMLQVYEGWRFSLKIVDPYESF
jgi:hypothetical protein